MLDVVGVITVLGVLLAIVYLARQAPTHWSREEEDDE